MAVHTTWSQAHGHQRGNWPGTRRPARSTASQQSHLGWQPSQFLTDRAEAERAFTLAEQLGRINVAAALLPVGRCMQGRIRGSFVDADNQ
jgi:hypothetical protein